MGKHQKGRRHRRVNRTPRPVSRTGRDRAAQGAPSVAAAPAPASVGDSLVLPSQGRPAAVPVPEPGGSAFASKADGGLGHPARRTWSALRAAGTRESGVGELCEAVGFTERTVLKHLEGLAAHGLAVQGVGGGWVAADAVQGLPEPRPGNAALARTVL